MIHINKSFNALKLKNLIDRVGKRLHEPKAHPQILSWAISDA